MAKGSRGGKRGSGGASGSSNVTQNASGGASSFSKMSSDQQAQMITNSIGQQTPNFLSDTAFQRFMYANDFDGKPQIVDDKTLDGMTGINLFRNVNATYNSKTDVGYSADEIAQQIQLGDYTRYSDSGGSVYGRGIYFANDYGSSASYGRTTGNVKKTAVVRAKLNSNAKVAYAYDLDNDINKEVKSGSSLGKALSKLDRADKRSIYALSKGYNVISADRNINSSGNYLAVLDRSALSISSSIKAKSRKW